MKKMCAGILLILALSLFSCGANEPNDTLKNKLPISDADSENINEQRDDEQKENQNIEENNEETENVTDDKSMETKIESSNNSETAETNNEKLLLKKGDYEITAFDFDSIMKLSYEERACEFLSALCLGDIRVVELYTSGKGHDGYKNVSMDAWIEDYEFVERCYEGKVKLNVYESDCDTFPVGEHDYILSLHHGIEDSWVKYFGPAEDYIGIQLEREELDNKIQDAVIFADEFIAYNLRLDESSFKKKLLPENFHDGFLHIINHTIWDCMGENKIREDTLGTLKEYIYLRFGYDVGKYPEVLKQFEYYSEQTGETNYILHCAHGGEVYCRTLETIEITDKGCNITLALYTDFAHLEKAKEVTFVFEENENSDIMRLVDIYCKMLSDTEVATYSI